MLDGLYYFFSIYWLAERRFLPFLLVALILVWDAILKKNYLTADSRNQ